MELKKSEFYTAPQLAVAEGREVAIHFDAEHVEVPDTSNATQHPSSTDEDPQESRAVPTKTIIQAYTVRVQQPLGKDKIVNAIVSAAYPSDKMQAIINNHFLNLAAQQEGESLDADEQAHEQEYQQMQEWRKHAKQIAAQVLAYME